MAVLELRDEAGGSSARILTHLGFNLFSFEVTVEGRRLEVLDAVPGFAEGQQRPASSGIPLLFPFPNRIRQGAYVWEGRPYQLVGGDQDRLGNAIHGLVHDRPWRVALADDQVAVGEFQLSVDAPERVGQWPADFLLQVRYTLRGPCLRGDVRIVNASEGTLPWGFGTHPYFAAPLTPESSPADCLIQVPAPEVWELKDFLPTGRRLPVDARTDLRNGRSLAEPALDDVLGGIVPTDGRVETVVMDARAGLQMTQVTDGIFQECVVYMPPGRRSVCLEPYTCPTDAINLQARGISAGWRMLKPRDEFRTWFELHVGRILV